MPSPVSPITVAQFRQYVEASGNKPDRNDWSLEPANTPLVYVSWHIAIAFCDWLTERWQERGCLPDGWRVDLPNEPEWEKAARGGDRIPVAPVMPLQPSEIFKALSESWDLTDNPLAQSIFPWGNEDSDLAERMNFNMDIGFVSAVGCYPAGSSPYGCEEMSGNVWEWTRSRYQDNPYPEQQALRQQREDRGQSPCVLRGGSFGDYRRYARCASRSRCDPVSRNSRLGFRVVLFPLPLTDVVSGR